ncbi:putative colanic acid biosynthesis acetyltransferase WcaF [Novosphingobium chloroacetimidivorans]|uniref:Putative colanic acid biosynthesis acetyltransferase WcaF n=1 Tax=Novosphingobium chloroacetimidivorans TaxID=1428314 RepID=A0A7W7NWH4_9SPHN|nr:putative colanic acid biosynthesis acetyltransferase [Novosphingobium chloroacetimidivorans]MBB4858112.1 putative colanic acid biosynthesis acetyltransferase WcaF [Novosphingobium chloroacetimidivorans]
MTLAARASAPNPVLDARETSPRTGGASFTLRLRIARVMFGLCWLLLAAWTPPALRGWRRLLLRAFGAKLGRGANVYASARIWHPAHLVMGDYATIGRRVNCYNQAMVSLGDYAVVSQDATLCAGTHDYDDPEFQLHTRPIALGPHSWVAAEAFVGPGVVVGDYAVLGARGVAMRDLAAGMVHAGHPAVPIKRRALAPDRPKSVA